MQVSQMFRSKENKKVGNSPCPSPGRKVGRNTFEKLFVPLDLLSSSSLPSIPWHKEKSRNYVISHSHVFILQATKNPGWLEGMFPARAVWKWSKETPGVPSVIPTSLWKLPTCFAENYSVAQLSLSWGELTLEKEMDRPGLKNTNVKGTSHIFHSAL